MPVVAIFDPNASVSGTFNTKVPVGGKFLLTNQSNVNLNLKFADGNTEYAAAWQITPFLIPTKDPNVKWSQQSVLAGSAPISQVTIKSYLPGDKIEGTYPVAIQHTSYIPNQVSTSSVVNTLSNENNAVNTEVIDIGTVNNSKLIDIFNDHFSWSIEQNGIKHQVIQGRIAGKPLLLGQAGDHTEVLGTLDIDTNLFVQNTTQLDGGNASTDGTGILTATGFKTSTNTLAVMSVFGPYTVNATSAFFNHNLKDASGNNIIPDVVFLQVQGTSNNSYTIEYESSSMNSTQVKLTSNLSGVTVIGMAFKRV